MLSIVKSIVLNGLEGVLIDIEVDVSSGLPTWEIIGLADISVKESKERVKTAIKNSGIDLYSRKYIINLSPADLKKEGTFLDLPISIGILKAIGVIKKVNINNIIFLGELSLDGRIKEINGVLPMCLEAVKCGIKTVIVPKGNAKEAGIVKNIDVIGVRTLTEVIKYLNGEIKIEKENVNIEELFKNSNTFNIDFSDVKGQTFVKRALEISASGSHNILMIGSPRFW